MSGRDLDVVSKLKIVGEHDSVSAGDVAERLEVVHGQGIAFNEGTSNELGKDCQSHLNASHGLDDADGNDKHKAKCKTVENDTRRSVSVPASNTRNTKCNSANKANHVPPLRNFTVGLHETSVNVEVVNLLSALGLPPHAVEKTLEASDNFASMEQKSIGKGRSVNTEEEDVDDNISSAQEGGRVVGVLLGIEKSSVVDGSSDVVQLAPAIVDTVGVDGKISSVVDVGVPEAENHPHGDESANKSVESTEERNHKRVSRIPEENVPIPGWEWVDAKTVVETSNGVEVTVIGIDPGHPAEVGERSPDIVGEPEPDKHSTEHDIKELDTRDAPDLAKGTLYRGVVVSMES